MFRKKCLIRKNIRMYMECYSARKWTRQGEIRRNMHELTSNGIPKYGKIQVQE